MVKDLPSISVIFATLNAAKVLEACLKSISEQDYPKKKVEVIIGDGGSIDGTLEIARRYGVKIIENPLKTSEAGKAVTLKYAKGDLVAFIDSDNILPNKNWFKEMVEPFNDKEIITSEPIAFTYRKTDPWLTRYFALLGMNDPICLFIGNYDRKSVLTGRWTSLKFEEEDKGGYLKVKLDHEPIPTIGANGTLIRRKVLIDNFSGDYLFDIDVILRMMRSRGQIYIAKVKNGIVHTYVEKDMKKFFKKQVRRINDMSFHRSRGSRETDWEKDFFWKAVWFQFQCFLVFPILWQTIKGFVKKLDIAWVFHPIACYSTWLIYLYGWIKGKVRPAESSREGWKQ